MNKIFEKKKEEEWREDNGCKKEKFKLEKRNEEKKKNIR